MCHFVVVVAGNDTSLFVCGLRCVSTSVKIVGAMLFVLYANSYVRSALSI